jgi:hypothetical protein
MEEKSQEAFVSVDVETAGPNPAQYALFSLGACLVSDPERGFYVELKPSSLNATTEALSVHQLSLEQLAETDLPPSKAMSRFETWLKAEVPAGYKPVRQHPGRSRKSAPSASKFFNPTGYPPPSLPSARISTDSKE